MFLRHFQSGICRSLSEHTLLICNNSSIIKCCYSSGTKNKIPDLQPVKLPDWQSRYTEPPKSSEDIEPKAKEDTSFAWFKHGAPNPNSLYVGNIKNWYENNLRKTIEEDQKCNIAMHTTLGSNIAAAYFVLRWHGKVKFQGKDWIQSTEDEIRNLPKKFNPNYVITDIDASETFITYYGLQNMVQLKFLKWLSLRGCKYLDDWCIDKISAEYPALEYLDISECPNVSERGLEAIYKLFNLKKLIVTNHHKSAAFELTCFLLEDVNPNLNCEIIVPQEEDETRVK